MSQCSDKHSCQIALLLDLYNRPSTYESEFICQNEVSTGQSLATASLGSSPSLDADHNSSIAPLCRVVDEDKVLAESPRQRFERQARVVVVGTRFLVAIARCRSIARRKGSV